MTIASEFEIAVTVPEGTSLAATGTILDHIARDVRGMRGVTATQTTAGGGSLGAVNSGTVYVKMVDEQDRNFSQNDLMTDVRELLKKFPPELRTSVGQAGGQPGGGRNAAFQYALAGPDLDKLALYSKTLLEKLKSLPDAVDADTSLVLSKPELRVDIDRERAADLGVRAGDIAQALNILVAGQTVSSFDAGIDQYDVILRAGDESRSSAESLKRLIVTSTKSGWVSMEDVVHIKEGEAPSVIERLDRGRQVTLYANIAPGGSQAKIISTMDDAVKEMNMEPGYTARTAGFSKELGRTGYYFVLAISLSFIFMYMVLAAQFESFLHPITILLTLTHRGAVRNSIAAGVRPDGQHLLRPGPAAAVRHCEEERDSADRPYQRPARQRHADVRSDHSGQPGPLAAHSDDHCLTGRRHAAAGDLQRPRRGQQSIDRNPGGRRTVPLSVADASDRPGFLRDVRGLEEPPFLGAPGQPDGRRGNRCWFVGNTEW